MDKNLENIERKQEIHNVGDSKEFYAHEEQHKIEELILWLKEAKKQGATHVEFSGFCFDDQIHTIYAQPCYLDLEPEEEFKKRVQEAKWSEREKKINALQKERELYESLKQKFENGDPFSKI